VQILENQNKQSKIFSAVAFLGSTFPGGRIIILTSIWPYTGRLPAG